VRASLATTPELQRSLERFYHLEARLLDSRHYQQWLSLVSQAISYSLPSRTNPLVDNRLRGSESMISIDNELERSDSSGCPIREEGYIHLMLRVERAFKMNSWSENPPARTRRIIGNIELMADTDEGLEVWSNFHLHYARPGVRDVLYSGQRRDLLLTDSSETTMADYTIARREVILDYADIHLPTVGLLF